MTTSGKNRRLYLPAIVVLGATMGLSGLSQLRAPAAREAEAAIRQTIDGAFAVLKDRDLAGREQRTRRIAALRQVADRTFDWAEMARSSLGVKWRGLTPQQRSRFVEVFKDVLAAEYMDDIDRFQGTETVTVDGSEQQGDEVLVRTTLITASRERVPLDYRLRRPAVTWMVVDISIEGVSLVNHFRRTFSNALVNMTVDELIARLSRQLPR
jgi:phospholipid transport system substrate-binding protein